MNIQEKKELSIELKKIRKLVVMIVDKLGIPVGDALKLFLK
jgi:hypothetical protein